MNGIERSAFAPEISVFVMERAVMRLCVQSPTPSALWNSSASVRVSRSVAHATVCARACVRDAWACVDLGVSVGVGVGSDRYDGLTD